MKSSLTRSLLTSSLSFLTSRKTRVECPALLNKLTGEGRVTSEPPRKSTHLMEKSIWTNRHPIMGKNEDTCDLTEDEYLKLLEVIKRDFEIRQAEKKRIDALESEVQQIKSRTKLLTLNPKFNDSCCLSCCSSFVPLIFPRVTCTSCNFNFCRKCLPPGDLSLVCSSCLRERDCTLQKNSWFYDAVKSKFGTHGSTKIVRDLHKRNSLANSEADSGKLFKDSHLDSSISSSSAYDPIFSSYKESLDSSLREVRKAFEKNNLCFGEADNSLKYNETLRSQKVVISLLLGSVLRDAREEYRNNYYHDQNQERLQSLDHQTIEDFLSYAMNENKDHLYLFNINSKDLNADDYIEQLSEAIIDKTIEDLTAQEEGRTSKRFSYTPDKLTLAVLAKMSRTSDEIDASYEDDNNNKNVMPQDLMKSKNSEVHKDEEDCADLESLRSFTESKKGEVPLPLVELPLEYTKKLYGIEDKEKIIGGRPLSFVDPDLDTISMTSSSSIANHVASSNRQSPHEDTWNLGGRGSFIMKKRIPYGVNDHYGTERKGDDDDDDDVREGEDIEDDNNINDDDDDAGRRSRNDVSAISKREDFVMFLPYANSTYLADRPGPMGSTDQASMDDPDILENTNLSMFKRKQSLENERLKLSSCFGDEDGHEQAPKFQEEPQDVAADLGTTLKVECVVAGEPPIDIRWYKQSSANLIELNGTDERYVTWQRGGRHALEVSSVTNEDQGHYLCMALNKFGRCQKGFRMSLLKEKNIDSRAAKNTRMQHLLPARADVGADNDRDNSLKTSRSSESSRNDKDSEHNLQPTSLVKNESFSGRQKKSSLSRRWLLGVDSDVSSRKDLEDSGHDGDAKQPETQLAEHKIATEAECLAHQRITQDIQTSSSNNNDRRKSKEDHNSKLIDHERTISLQDTNNSSMPDPRSIISQHIKKDFVVKTISNESGTSDSRSGSMQRPSIESVRVEQKNFVIRSITKSVFSEDRHQTTSPGDDVFSGESSDLGEELATTRMPSVKELRKKFTSEVFNAPNSKGFRINEHARISSPERSRKDIPHVTPNVPFRQHSYVPLSPLPINRTRGSIPDDDRRYTSHDDVIEIRERQIHSNPRGDGIYRHDSGSLYSSINAPKQSQRRVLHGDSRVSILSQSSFASMQDHRVSTGQLLGSRSISNDPTQTGTFVSKVVIGTDCDIVSSSGEIHRTKRK